MPVAQPDRIRKSQFFLSSDVIPTCDCVRKTMPHAKTNTTIVRIAVARCDCTPCKPTLAKIDVIAAQIAEQSA